MLTSSVLAIFLISWSSLFLIDYVLRLKNFLPYVHLVERYGLEVAPFQIRVYTARYEEITHSLKKNGTTSLRRTLLKIWFGIGAIISVVCMFIISVYLSKLLYSEVYTVVNRSHPPVRRFLAQTTREPERVTTESLPPQFEEYDVLDGSEQQSGGLVPIIPGYNLPWSHIPLFMLVLVVAAIFHEYGHAAAAKTRDVKVNGFGVFLFALYPGAFTDIDPDSLNRSSAFSRLMIFGAGIWHNLVLASIAYLLFYSTSFMLVPLFSEGHGVTITGVDSRSGLHGPAGLFPGQVVENIEGCPVFNLHSWRECVRVLEHQHNGRCVPEEQLSNTESFEPVLSDDEIICCHNFTNISHAHMCFVSNVVQISKQRQTKAPSLDRIFRNVLDEVVQEVKSETKRFSCMSARLVTEFPTCNTTVTCEKDYTCAYPALYNETQLVRITLKGDAKPVLYVGNLDELISFVSIHHLVHRWDWVPHYIATSVETFPKYLFTLSFALGVLNAVPCYSLDGQFIVNTIVDVVGARLSRRSRRQIVNLVLLSGSLLLGFNILFGLLKLIF